MVDTIKFSEFNDGGDLSNDETTVGLGSGVNTKFNNPWTFLRPGTTGMRPAPVAAIYYRLRFNTTLQVYEYYDPLSTTWTQLSGTGTGTVNPGLANDLAFYAVSGQIISPINGALSSVLVTNALGVPSLSTTLPSGLSIPGATITGSTAALLSGSIIAAPVAGTDLVNKDYVDGVVGGAVLSITGTANQIIASSPTGNVTLSLPQDIAVGSTPTFLGLTLTTTPLGISSGGTNLSALPTVAIASTYAAWDANLNLSANNFQSGYFTTATAAGNTILTVASAAAQFFTGVTTQTVTMPVTSTLRIGHHFYVVNNSSGSITINSSGGNAIQIMAPGTTCNLTCILTSGTTAASWYAEYAFQSGSSTGTVNAGLINQLAWYAANGTAVSGLATANDSVLVTSAAGVPSLSTTLPTGLTITSPFINEIKDQTNSKVVASFTSDAAAINHINFFASPTNQNVIMSALGTDANIILAILGKGTGGVAVQGSTSGTPYAAGYVGEVVSAVVTAASATAYTTGTTVNITSLLVQPGKWIIHPNFGIQGTTVLATVAGVSTTSATLPAQELTSYIVPAGGGASARAPTPILSINISVATTYYLVVQSAGTGSMTMFGRLIAERIA
jgi:hypothetical protein